MKVIIGLVIFVMVFIFCVIGYSATIYVPNDYTTIHGAIDAASSEDTIIVGTGTMTFYINGDSVTTRTQSGDVNVNYNDLFIRSADTSGSQPFYGYIDDVRVYNTALSESEIGDDGGI